MPELQNAGGVIFYDIVSRSPDEMQSETSVWITIALGMQQHNTDGRKKAHAPAFGGKKKSVRAFYGISSESGACTIGEECVRECNGPLEKAQCTTYSTCQCVLRRILCVSSGEEMRRSEWTNEVSMMLTLSARVIHCGFMRFALQADRQLVYYAESCGCAWKRDTRARVGAFARTIA